MYVVFIMFYESEYAIKNDYNQNTFHNNKETNVTLTRRYLYNGV